MSAAWAAAGPSRATSSFPVVGDQFSSASSFKLAAYRACLAHGVSPSYRVGAAIRCRLTSLSTCDDPIPYDGGGGTPCRFFIAASNRPFGVGLALVAVTECDLEHSCSTQARGVYFTEFKSELEERIARMEEAVGREEEEAAAAAREASSSSEEEEGVWAAKVRRRARAAKLEGEQKRRASGAGSLKRASRASIDLTAEGSESEDDPGVDIETRSARFPAAADVQPLINKLIENGTVDFPEYTDPKKTDTFASASSLLALLYAYAQQRNFSLYRQSDAYSTTRFRLACWRSHARYTSQPGGRCRTFIIASLKDDDGRWSLDEAVLEHNHELSPESRPLSAADRARALARKRARRSSPPLSPDLAPQSFASMSKASVAPMPPHSAAVAAVAEQLRFASSEQYTPPLPGPPAPASDTITLFLVGALPQLDPALVDSVASTLQRFGLSTVEDLALFLALERDTVVAFEDEKRRHDEYRDCSWSLVDLHEGLNEAAALSES
ncbi:hypothetical protein JCM8208_000661 [Rhodotorula glutinis]